MSTPIISVRNLGKRYRLGAASKHDTLRDRLSNSFRSLLSPFRQRAEGNGTSNPALETAKPPANTEEFWALREVSFDINQGEVVGIIGRNGAGKSTLLKLLSQITEPTRGEIRIRGRVASLLEVGTGFHPELTGRENIFLNGAILGMTQAEIRKKFDEIVAFSEIERFLDTPVKRYSSGMYVRLAFAVAAHLDPEILIVDEVLAVGDVRFQEKCLGKMQNIAAKGMRTVLFVSHHLASLSKLCSRGIILSGGEVAADKTAAKAIEHYVSELGNRTGEVTWPVQECPGNEIARMKAVRIIGDGKITSEVRTGGEVIVEMEYECLREQELVACSIHLLDGLGSCILASSNLPSANAGADAFGSRPLPAGHFITRCKIPQNFLNESNYGISAFLVHNHTKIIAQAVQVLNFIAHDSGEMRAEYVGPWIGLIRPKLDWTTRETN